MARHTEGSLTLAEQSLDALWTLLAGLQQDNDSSRESLESGCSGHIFNGLLAILLRLKLGLRQRLPRLCWRLS